MSLIDKLGQGLPIAIIGYVLVFVVLAILWGIIEIMHYALTPKEKKANADKSTNSTADIKTETVVEAEQVEDGELVAILTAAVAASLNTSTYNLKIKSFKRIDTKNNVWANASRNDAINNF